MEKAGLVEWSMKSKALGLSKSNWSWMFSVVMIMRMENTWGLRRSTTEPIEGSLIRNMTYDMFTLICDRLEIAVLNP